MALLQRLYDPTGGTVLVDGQDLRSLDASWQAPGRESPTSAVQFCGSGSPAVACLHSWLCWGHAKLGFSTWLVHQKGHAVAQAHSAERLH